MKCLSGFVVGALLTMLFAMPGSAQQPGTANDPHHPATPSATTTAPVPTPTHGSKSGDMPMMEMCHQMMGDTMGMPMMGGATMDPKERADMLQMRGEMMKAMGDIMMKHARRMQGTPGK
jgi:hypothetical protein